eukprot:sb/3466416/
MFLLVLLLPIVLQSTMIDGVRPNIPNYAAYYPITEQDCILNCYVDKECQAVYFYPGNGTCFAYDRVSVTYTEQEPVKSDQMMMTVVDMDAGYFASMPLQLGVVDIPTPGISVLIINKYGECFTSQGPAVFVTTDCSFASKFSVWATEYEGMITLRIKKGCLYFDTDGPKITKDCEEERAHLPNTQILVNHTSVDLSNYKMYRYNEYTVCQTSQIMDYLPNAFVLRKNENPLMNPFWRLDAMCRKGFRLESDPRANFFQIECQENGEWSYNDVCVATDTDIDSKKHENLDQLPEDKVNCTSTCECGILGDLSNIDKILVTVFLISSYIIVAVAARIQPRNG